MINKKTLEWNRKKTFFKTNKDKFLFKKYFFIKSYNE